MSFNQLPNETFSPNQFDILLKLYQNSFSDFDSMDVLNQTIVKATASGLEVDFASLWFFKDDQLECTHAYNAVQDVFGEQEIILKSEIPLYYEALQKGLVIKVDDAITEEITNEFKSTYLIPNGIQSILDIPIRHNGELVGVLCCEHSEVKAWTEIEIHFAQTIAGIYSQFSVEYKKRLAEKSLIENQERFKFLSENISDGIYIIENEKLVFASKRYLEIIGLTENHKLDLHNRDMFSLVHPEDVEKVREAIYSAAEKKLPSVKYTFRCLRSDGQYIWREDIMNIHYDVSGKAFRAVTIARDVTFEKEADLELERKKKQTDLHNSLLLKLYGETTFFSFDEKIALVLQIAKEGLQLERASYWEIQEDNLVCKKIVATKDDLPASPMVLEIRSIPKYMSSVNNNIPVVADDVETNEWTSELLDTYLKPLGITDMLDVPIRAEGAFFGVICCEHSNAPRVWLDTDVAFARSLADYLSLAVEEEKRLEAERLLNENQKNLEFIANHTTDGIMIFESGKIVYLSPTYKKLAGQNSRLKVGIDADEIFKFIHPDDITQVIDLYGKAIATHKVRISYKYRVLGEDATYYWREDNASIIYKGDTSDIDRVIVISRDVHENKLAEIKIKEHQDQISLIFENSTDGFLIIEQAKVTFISPSYQKFLGFTEEELQDFPATEIFALMHPDDAEQAQEIIYGNLNNRVTTFTARFRIRKKDGTYHWREDLANIIYNEDGSYSKYIINSRDIDERMQMEAQLIDSERQLRLITENTSDGVVVIEDSKLTYVSPSFYKLLGFPSGYYKQMTMQDVFENMHPEDAPKVKEIVYGGLAQQKSEFKYEHRFKDVHGIYHWREDSANVLYDANGKYTKYIVITRDITARKEAEKEKNRLYRITEKQNEKLINFTHIVSHDIRSHTSNLSMILDLYEETDSQEEKNEYFAMLKQSTNKLTDTIYFLNETVAIQSGLKSEKVLLNLREEIEKALIGINAVVKTSEADIQIQVDESITIEATQSYLESVIFNLLTNAIKYKSPERNPVITIKAVQTTDELVLSIADNGMGIDLGKNKEKIFGMYKTFHGNPDAVGLGLFMVKNHVESMGGRIEVESEVGVGTTFKLYFI
ncbi:PAS domain S-box protein [Flavobacterium sp.]|uniref:PAS domain S-box protein n=1 Tax=Flavobacterium sp. TaxID=239 RepID=UPI003D0A5BB2